ncbi:MAG: HD domain-containing protein [Thermotogae bacterium]|nr:HD domain-containing protein [Thermotogota bacterium]MCP5465660.1 HD domain-containing protein [Thermotogota bacterium]HOO74178.1 HD domain-containing protein [Tepiditoga sp.]
MEKTFYIKEAEKFLMSHNLKGSHDAEHILRVTDNALKISEKEGGNKEIIIISSLLHDIARSDEYRKEMKRLKLDHADYGAILAEGFLKGINYEYVKEVVYSIKCHRYSKGIIPETLEAKILQDADRLDAIGAVGIYRVFTHNPDEPMQLRINHFHEKILNLKDGMNTQTGKLLAGEKHEIVANFVAQIEKEMKSVYIPESL